MNKGICCVDWPSCVCALSVKGLRCFCLLGLRGCEWEGCRGGFVWDSYVEWGLWFLFVVLITL